MTRIKYHNDDDDDDDDTFCQQFFWLLSIQYIKLNLRFFLLLFCLKLITLPKSGKLVCFDIWMVNLFYSISFHFNYLKSSFTPTISMSSFNYIFDRIRSIQYTMI